MHTSLSPEINRLLRETECLQISDIPLDFTLEVRFTEDRSFTFKRVEGETFAILVGPVPAFKLESLQVDDRFLARVCHETLVSLPLEGKTVGIAGGCTYNPSAQLGCSMLHIGHIDKGRSLLWRIEDGDEDTNIISPKTVIGWTVSPPR
jgi:hypothetical protein